MSKRDIFKHNFGLIVGMAMGCVIVIFLGRQFYYCWMRNETCCKRNVELDDKLEEKARGDNETEV
jgi:hypothetical protein